MIRLRSFSPVVALLPLLGACSWGPEVRPDYLVSQAESQANHSAARDQIAFHAMQMVGTPYRYGGHTPQGFDCSGLVFYTYGETGISVPRTSAEQFRAASPVNMSNVQAGDLLFFRIDGKVSHVGIYIGNQRFVHAPSTGHDVTFNSLSDDYYREHFVGARRLIQ